MKTWIKNKLNQFSKWLKSLITFKVKTGLVLVSLVLVGIGFYKVNQFFEAHQFVFESPVTLQTPVYLIDRVEAETIVVKQNTVPLNSLDTYICQKFGSQCRNALTIQHLENGTEQCDRMHVNTNGTVDFGVFQINSVHLNSSIKLSDLVDCQKNVDIAYDLYSKQGWGIWSTAKLAGIK